MMQPVNIEGPLGSRIMAAHAVPLWVGGPERQVTLETDLASIEHDLWFTSFIAALDMYEPLRFDDEDAFPVARSAMGHEAYDEPFADDGCSEEGESHMTRNALAADIRNPRLAQLVQSLNATVDAVAQAAADALVSDPTVAFATDNIVVMPPVVTRYPDEDGEWVGFTYPSDTDYRD